MSKNAMSFFRRQLITESGAVSSWVPQGTHDIQGIATFLNYYSNLSISAIKEAATWKSTRVFAMRYLTDMSATRSRLKGMGPLIAAGSAVHQHSVTGVCVFYLFSLYCFGFISGIFTYEQFPFKSHPVLPFLDLFTVDGLCCAT